MRVTLLHLRADLRQIHENDIAQFFLRVVRDANGARAVFYLNPLVLFCVFECLWIAHVLARL